MFQEKQERDTEKKRPKKQAQFEEEHEDVAAETPKHERTSKIHKHTENLPRDSFDDANIKRYDDFVVSRLSSNNRQLALSVSVWNWTKASSQGIDAFVVVSWRWKSLRWRRSWKLILERSTSVSKAEEDCFFSRPMRSLSSQQIQVTGKNMFGPLTCESRWQEEEEDDSVAQDHTWQPDQRRTRGVWILNDAKML